MPDGHEHKFRGDEEGETEYAVRLLFNVHAHSPEHAVERFIDQINGYGLKSWVYRVVDTTDLSQFMVHPSENVTFTLEEFEQRMASAGDVEDVPTDGRL